MQITAATYKTQKWDGYSTRPTLSVVAIYNDFCAGIRAQEALQWLKLSLSFDMEVSASSWSYRSLERLDVRSVATKQATTADVIIVAASDAELVPDHVMRWLDASLQQQSDGGAVLVALHDEVQTPEEDPTPLCGYLERQADRWRTDFICNQDFDQRFDRDFALQCLSRRAPADTYLDQIPERYSNRDAYRWGINE
jgi:hypothetical protein